MPAKRTYKVPFRRRSKIWLRPGPGQQQFEFPAQPEPEREEQPPSPKGIQGPFGVSPTPDWDYYWPTRTINPPRPRTRSARYSAKFQVVEIMFRDGSIYHYENVSRDEWFNGFKRAESPGRYINDGSVDGTMPPLNSKPYAAGGWGSVVGE